jgi:mutual gliding-motility protein MglA
VSTIATTATRTCRLMYYGPIGSGKRENLRLIHQSIPPEQRLNLASGDPERQIAFSFRRDGDQDWQVLVQAVDTGAERFRMAGMPDEPPFDGVVFSVNSVASQLDQSLASMEALKTFLDSWGQDLMGIPVVIQYNRREENQVLAVDRLESLLNPWGLLSFPASSKRGEGVRETLKAILGLTVNHLNQKITDRGPAPSLQEEDPAAEEVQQFQGEGGLALEYGPPLPGTEIEERTHARGDQIFNELRPPVVVPVTIPRRLLDGGGPVRILLEVQVED